MSSKNNNLKQRLIQGLNQIPEFRTLTPRLCFVRASDWDNWQVLRGFNEVTQIACVVSQPLRTPRDIPNTRRSHFEFFCARGKSLSSSQQEVLARIVIKVGGAV